MPYSYKNSRKAPVNFPYTEPTTAYFVVESGVPRPITMNAATAKNIKWNDADIYAVWPGKKERSDMFLVDKLDLVKAFVK